MQGGFRAYWWRVVKRATKDTAEFVGTNPKKIALGFTSTIISFGLAFSMLGHKADEKIMLGLLGLIPGAAIFLFSWGIYLAKTPCSLENEMTLQHDNEVQERKNENDLLHEKLNEIGGLIKSQAIAHDKEVALQKSNAEIEAAELKASLERAKNVDPKRNAMRHEMERFQKHFEAVRNKAVNGEQVPADQIYPQEVQAFHYIQQHLPEYRHFATDCRIHSSHPRGLMLPPQEAAEVCRKRLEKLREVIEMLWVHPQKGVMQNLER